MNKIVRLHSVSGTIEKGFVHIPTQPSGSQNTCTKSLLSRKGNITIE
jgi:hypothetical protein